MGGDQDEETTVTFVSRLELLLVRWRLRARVSGAWSVVLAWLGRSGVTGRDEPTPEASLGDCIGMLCFPGSVIRITDQNGLYYRAPSLGL